MDTQKDVRINFWVTEKLRKEYKMYCLENDIDMSSQLRDFIKSELEKDNSTEND